MSLATTRFDSLEEHSLLADARVILSGIVNFLHVNSMGYTVC